MVYIESEVLELKAKFTDTICKEIVAFLNTNGGDIIIGIDDNGKVVGLNNIDEISKKISDIITDQIEPNPQSIISSEIRYDEGKMLFVVHVQKGVSPLYCQKKYGFSSAGCVMRIGTTCKNMTSEQIHVRYEKNFIDSDLMTVIQAKYGSISFKTLKIYYTEKGYHLDDSSFETNLNLRTPNGEYNLLAELLSDKNMIPLITVKFQGTDKTSVSERNDYGNQCLLFSYEQIKNRIAAENICVVDTTVRPRVDRFLFDFDSVNEAVINALVHNDWNSSQPLISFFSDRIEILSKYGEEAFDIGDSYVIVTIPYDKDVLSVATKRINVGANVVTNVGLNATEKRVIFHLLENPASTADDMSIVIGVTKRTIERTLKKLQEKGLLVRTGAKKSGSWIVIK